MIALIDTNEKEYTISDLFTPLFRKAFIIGICKYYAHILYIYYIYMYIYIGLSLAQQASGINIVMFFSEPILHRIYNQDDPIPNVISLCIGLCNVGFTLFCLFAVDSKYLIYIYIYI